MTQQDRSRDAWKEGKTDIVGAVSFGMFLIVIGAVFASTPNLAGSIWDMINDVRLEEVYPNIYFPALQSEFPVVYNAFFQVCVAMLVISAILLVIRLIVNQQIKWKAEGVGNVVFWACVAWIASMIVADRLNSLMVLGYFIASIGLSMIANNAIVIAYWRLRGS